MKQWLFGSDISTIGLDPDYINHGLNNLCYDGTHYYCIWDSSNDPYYANHQLVRSSDGTNWTIIYTHATDFENEWLIDRWTTCRAYDGNIYFSFMTKRNADNKVIVYLGIWNGSAATVNSYTIDPPVGVLVPFNYRVQVTDIFKIGSTIYYLFHLNARDQNGYGSVFIFNSSGSLLYTQTLVEIMTVGCYYNSVYYFLGYTNPSTGTNPNDSNLYTFNGSSFTKGDSYLTYLPLADIGDYDLESSIYIKNSKIEFILNKKSIRWRYGTENFNSYNISEDFDSFTVNRTTSQDIDWIFFIQDTYIHGLYILPQGGVITIRNLRTDAISYGSYFISSANGLMVYTTACKSRLLTKTTMASNIYCVFKLNILDYTCIAFIYNYIIDDEQSIMIYDDSDNLLFFGHSDVDFIKGTNSSEEGIRFISPMNADLATTYSGTFASGTTETVISTILGTCKFCSAGTLSASGLTLAGAITYQNTPKSKIITDMLKLMARCVEINPSLQISAKSTPTDSTKTFTFETITSASGYNVSEVSKKKIKASNVKLRYGPSLTLYEQRGTAANEYEIQDVYPQITSATDIARIATQILSTAAPYYELVIDVWGNGKFTAGQTLTFSHSPESIPEESYYIVAENYNSTSGVAQIRIVNLIKYPIQNQIQQIQTQLDVVTTTANNALPLTGDQTIAGVKTFSSFPITPSSAPTTDYQVANKKYADDMDRYLQPTHIWGLNGFAQTEYSAATWSVTDSDTDASIVAKFIIGLSGSYKVLVISTNSANSITNSGQITVNEAGDGEARAATSLIAEAMDLVNNATAGRYKYTYSSAFTISANKVVNVKWIKDAAEAGNTLYIHMMVLIKQ